MKSSSEDVYQQIADLIHQSIPEDWEEAWAYAEMEEASGLTYGRYRKQGAKETCSFQTGHQFYHLFDTLRTNLKKPGFDQWTKAKFSLQRNGKFHVDFEYE